MSELPPPKVFPQRLKAARQAAGLTQEALGTAAGIDGAVARTRVNRYERGVSETDERTAAALARALGVPLASLYADSPTMALLIQVAAKLTAKELKALAEELLERTQAQQKGRKKAEG